MTIAAENAAERVEQLILLTERLADLIAQDAAAFEQRRPLEAAKNIEETSRLANIYRHESARVRADPRLVEAAPVNQRAALLRATEALDAVLARQGRALEAARTVTEGLVQAIAGEIANQRVEQSAYGANGVRSPTQAPTAITLNQRA
jgi:hypothetical protein